MSNSLSESGCMKMGVHGRMCLYSAYTAQGSCWQCAGQMLAERGHINRHAPAPMFKRQREEEEEEAEVVRRGVKKKKKAPVFSQGLLTDTKSVFVCLPGCQIKEFLCVGGSDRVYLTLQLLL